MQYLFDIWLWATFSRWGYQTKTISICISVQYTRLIGQTQICHFYLYGIPLVTVEVEIIRTGCMWWQMFQSANTLNMERSKQNERRTGFSSNQGIDQNGYIDVWIRTLSYLEITHQCHTGQTSHQLFFGVLLFHRGV